MWSLLWYCCEKLGRPEAPGLGSANCVVTGDEVMGMPIIDARGEGTAAGNATPFADAVGGGPKPMTVWWVALTRLGPAEGPAPAVEPEPSAQASQLWVEKLGNREGVPERCWRCGRGDGERSRAAYRLAGDIALGVS